MLINNIIGGIYLQYRLQHRKLHLYLTCFVAFVLFYFIFHVLKLICVHGVLLLLLFIIIFCISFRCTLVRSGLVHMQNNVYIGACIIFKCALSMFGRVFSFYNAFHFHHVFLIAVSFARLNVTSFICHFSTSLL